MNQSQGSSSDLFGPTLVSGNVTQSAVAEHMVSVMHHIEWEKAEVVENHSIYRQRCALDAWHIRTEAQIINRD